MIRPVVRRGRHAPPLEERLASQYARLLEATVDLAASEGYAACTADGISRHAGMSKATFYVHFPDKANAFCAAFSGHNGRLELPTGNALLDANGFRLVREAIPARPEAS